MTQCLGVVKGLWHQAMLVSFVTVPGGGVTQHMHIRGGKSDIFGSEYCEKRYFWVKTKLKLSS